MVRNNQNPQNKKRTGASFPNTGPGDFLNTTP